MSYKTTKLDNGDYLITNSLNERRWTILGVLDSMDFILNGYYLVIDTVKESEAVGIHLTTAVDDQDAIAYINEESWFETIWEYYDDENISLFKVTDKFKGGFEWMDITENLKPLKDVFIDNGREGLLFNKTLN